MNQRGFSLLEVLVAFTLLAVLFGALFEVFAGGLATVRKAGTRGYVTLLAQSKLAELSTGSRFASSSHSGLFESADGHLDDSVYRWTFSLERYPEDELGPVDRGPVTPYVATIEVQWDEAGRAQNLSLSTVVLGAR